MAIETHVAHDSHAEREARALDAAIAALARRQHGVVARSQLADLGLGRGAIEHRVALERLQPLHRGIYAVGHSALKREAWWVAALLAAGPGAALSYRSAAELWGLRQRSRGRTEVSVPRNRRSTPRLQVHVVEMQRDEVQDKGGIRVTTPARTLLDLAAVVSYDQLAHAFNEAEYRRLSSPTSLGALLARYPKRRGTADVRRVLENHARNGVTRTRSELERAFLALLDAHGLPRPQTNHLTDHGELDATWPEQRLVVEVDGWAGHGTRRAFEKDRARDRELVVAGWRVIRLTWRQLDEDGETIARQLSALLGATAPRRSARRARRPRPATRARRSAGP